MCTAVHGDLRCKYLTKPAKPATLQAEVQMGGSAVEQHSIQHVYSWSNERMQRPCLRA